MIPFTLATFLLTRSSNPAGLIVWCVIGLCAGIYLFYKGFRLLQQRHLILDTPVSKIRGASMGMVELNGQAVGPYTVVAPITQRPCYYYRTLVWEWRQAGKNKQWVKVAAECLHVPFFLDDNTGKVMVDPRGADLDLHRDFREEFCDSFFTTKQAAPDTVRNFLSHHGVSTNNKIKVEEFCIKPKNALFLLGTIDENPGIEVTPKPIQEFETMGSATEKMFSFSIGSTGMSFAGAGGGFGSGSLSELMADHSGVGASSDHPSRTASAWRREVVHLSPASGPASAAEMTQQQKIAAALLKAGITSPAAWAVAEITAAQAGNAATTEAVNSGVVTSDVAKSGASDGNGHTQAQSSAQGSVMDSFEAHPAVVLRKGKNNPTFLISWRSQREVAQSLELKCTLMIWGGPVLALLSLYVLLNISHLF